MHRKTGEDCKREWNIPVQQARFRENGTWYHILERFPAALCDAHGYVIFPTEQAYRDCTHLRIGKEISVPYGISKISGIVQMKAQAKVS